MGGSERDADFGGGSCEDFAERGCGVDGLAEADEAFCDSAFEGSFYFGAIEVALGLVEIGLGGADVGFGFAELGDTEDERRGFFVEADVFPVGAGLVGAGIFLDEGGFGAGEAGFCGEDGGFQVGGVELDEDVVFIEEGAVLEGGVNFDDCSADEGGEGCGVLGADDALGFDDYGVVGGVEDGFFCLEALSWSVLGEGFIDGSSEPFPCAEADREDQDGDEDSDEVGHVGGG